MRFLCRLRSIVTHRDHFVHRPSVCLSVRPSVRPSVCLSVCPSVTLAELCFAGDTCIPRNAATISNSAVADKNRRIAEIKTPQKLPAIR